MSSTETQEVILHIYSFSFMILNFITCYLIESIAAATTTCTDATTNTGTSAVQATTSTWFHGRSSS